MIQYRSEGGKPPGEFAKPPATIKLDRDLSALLVSMQKEKGFPTRGGIVREALEHYASCKGIDVTEICFRHGFDVDYQPLEVHPGAGYAACQKYPIQPAGGASCD